MRTLSLMLALLSASSALAAEHHLTMAPADTKVTFLLVATGHDVNGTFDLQSCDVTFDPEAGTASGEIALDARSGATGKAKRDKTMHAKVLRSTEFPAIVFRPEKLVGALAPAGPSDVTLTGTMTLAGGSHPFEMPVHVERSASGMHVRATFTVPYVEWGLEDPSVMFLKVEKEVLLTIDGDARVH